MPLILPEHQRTRGWQGAVIRPPCTHLLMSPGRLPGDNFSLPLGSNEVWAFCPSPHRKELDVKPLCCSLEGVPQQRSSHNSHCSQLAPLVLGLYFCACGARFLRCWHLWLLSTLCVSDKLSSKHGPFVALLEVSVRSWP